MKRNPKRRDGWSKLPNALVTHGMWANLSNAEARVYVALLAHRNAKGEAWPGLELLAQESGRHWTAVSKAIQGLAARGLLTIHRTPGRGNRYALLPVPKTPRTAAKGVPRKTHSAGTRTPLAPVLIPPSTKRYEREEVLLIT